jgi:hypothetical protein
MKCKTLFYMTTNEWSTKSMNTHLKYEQPHYSLEKPCRRVSKKESVSIRLIGRDTNDKKGTQNMTVEDSLARRYYRRQTRRDAH